MDVYPIKLKKSEGYCLIDDDYQMAILVGMGRTHGEAIGELERQSQLHHEAFTKTKMDWMQDTVNDEVPGLVICQRFYSKKNSLLDRKIVDQKIRRRHVF